jgi:hypothetical protein
MLDAYLEYSESWDFELIEDIDLSKLIDGVLDVSELWEFELDYSADKRINTITPSKTNINLHK